MDYQREDDEWNYDAYRKPEITFTNKANFFAGIPQSVLIGFGDTRIPNDNNIFAAYIQDQWRVTSKMTVNAGLRYDLEAYRRAFPRDPKTDSNNFGPRAGIAYAFSPRTSMHAAGGVFYGQIFGSLLQNSRQAQSRKQYTSTARTRARLWPGTEQHGRPGDRPRRRRFSRFPGSRRSISRPAWPADLDSPYAYQTSVGVQHQLTANMAIKTSYLYVGSRHEGVGRDVNCAAPLFFDEGQAMPNGLVAPPGGGYFYDRTRGSI